jgi:hypothetical protein
MTAFLWIGYGILFWFLFDLGCALLRVFTNWCHNMYHPFSPYYHHDIKEKFRDEMCLVNGWRLLWLAVAIVCAPITFLMAAGIWLFVTIFGLILLVSHAFRRFDFNRTLFSLCGRK